MKTRVEVEFDVEFDVSDVEYDAEFNMLDVEFTVEFDMSRIKPGLNPELSPV